MEADWLEALVASDRIEDLATDLAVDGADWIESLLRLCGTFDASAFPKAQT